MKGIGIDIGGMSVKIGLVNDCGEIEERAVFTTPKNFEDLVKHLVYAINDMLRCGKTSVRNISGIGIGCPGVINSNGVVLSSCNLALENAPLKEELLKRFNTNIKISNDANVATLGEVKFGVAKGVKNAVMLTLGTGVGGGVVINGKLFEGGNSTGAELGHSTLVFGGEECACGRRGCMEKYVSATALIRDTKKAMMDDKNSSLWEAVDGNIDFVNGKTVFDEAKKGDVTANMVVDNFVSYLGDSIMSLNNIFRPEIFILGGGISAQGEYLTDKIIKYCEKYFFGYKGTAFPKIKTATLFNDAGIIGAYSLTI